MATVQNLVAATTVESSALVPFKNEPLLDFTRHENVRAMRAALDKVRHQLGREYENVIAGHRLQTEAKLQSINPSHPEQVVGVFQKAGVRRRSGGCRSRARSLRELEPHSGERARGVALPGGAYLARAQVRVGRLAGL